MASRIRRTHPLAWFRTIAARFTLVMEFCHHCGRTQPFAWSIDDETWERVTGAGNGVLCLHCFDRMAREQGLWPIYRIRTENVPWVEGSEGAAND